MNSDWDSVAELVRDIIDHCATYFGMPPSRKRKHDAREHPLARDIPNPRDNSHMPQQDGLLGGSPPTSEESPQPGQDQQLREDAPSNFQATADDRFRGARLPTVHGTEEANSTLSGHPIAATMDGGNSGCRVEHGTINPASIRASSQAPDSPTGSEGEGSLCPVDMDQIFLNSLGDEDLDEEFLASVGLNFEGELSWIGNPSAGHQAHTIVT
jgi:hypothetical protein